jgi:DtxR family transcriptional regulator, Mn-dependent transcriptional regulator
VTAEPTRPRMVKTAPRLSVAQEDYLRAISKLEEGAEPVTISALAQVMKVKAPSVTGMIQRLADEGLVRHNPRSHVRLSRKGREMAQSVHRRHRLVETFLVQVLGLDWSLVHEEAEALEHHLSDRLVKAIDRYLGYPRVDPHGHPIPTSDGKVIDRKLVPMETLDEGEAIVIREIRSDVPERIRLWESLGLVPGAVVTIVKKDLMEGVWVLETQSREIVTGLNAVAGLFVERGAA